ncbi:MAG: hypothetical protein V4858_10030 [Pseudomonadota bacterium]
MISTRLIGVIFCSMALLLSNAPLQAQEGRDPTVAPAETGAIVQSPTGVEGMTVLVRGDRPYLVVGTRLYAPGDKVGNLRVERITETEVWFHDGSALTKVPRFAGITRTVIVAKPSCADNMPSSKAEPTSALENASAKSTKKKARKNTQDRQQALTPSPPSAVAPCEDTQP